MDSTRKLEKKPNTSHRVGENICQLYIRQRADSQNIKGIKKLNFPKINEPIKKWATELNRSFSTEEIQIAKRKPNT
jgi:hypothetical protein